MIMNNQQEYDSRWFFLNHHTSFLAQTSVLFQSHYRHLSDENQGIVPGIFRLCRLFRPLIFISVSGLAQ
jgi:hypothetical protein